MTGTLSLLLCIVFCHQTELNRLSDGDWSKDPNVTLLYADNDDPAAADSIASRRFECMSFTGFVIDKKFCERVNSAKSVRCLCFTNCLILPEAQFSDAARKTVESMALRRCNIRNDSITALCGDTIAILSIIECDFAISEVKYLNAIRGGALWYKPSTSTATRFDFLAEIRGFRTIALSHQLEGKDRDAFVARIDPTISVIVLGPDGPTLVRQGNNNE